MGAVRALTWALACLACAAPGAAMAQISFDAPAFVLKKPKPGPPDVHAKPPAWPRLDPGAVLCRSPDDLQRLAANRSGGPGGGPVSCRIISQPTPIQIVHRAGPGRTEVQVTPTAGAKSAETGWTDAWLPDKPPASANR